LISFQLKLWTLVMTQVAFPFTSGISWHLITSIFLRTPFLKDVHVLLATLSQRPRTRQSKRDLQLAFCQFRGKTLDMGGERLKYSAGHGQAVGSEELRLRRWTNGHCEGDWLSEDLCSLECVVQGRGILEAHFPTTWKLEFKLRSRGSESRMRNESRNRESIVIIMIQSRLRQLTRMRLCSYQTSDHIWLLLLVRTMGFQLVDKFEKTAGF